MKENMKFKKILRFINYWILPKGVSDIFVKIFKNFIKTPKEKIIETSLTKNKIFVNIHTQEKCFILATGPSIRYQNLKYLINETCFTTSDFYKHPDYQMIKPKYYCLAPLHPPFQEKDGIKRFNELHRASYGKEVYFFGLRDKNIYEKSLLVDSRDRVNFLEFIKMEDFPSEIDLTSFLPNPTSVSIIAISIAIYMGFKKIYLLGCDHDNLWLWDGKSKYNQLEHFYDGDPSIGYQHQEFDVDRTLRAHLKVREQYKWVNNVALSKGIQIFNASPKSYIDIFPRVKYEDLF